MKVSYNWLTEYVNIPWPAKDLVEKLTMSGTDIESIERHGSLPDKVIVGQIIAIDPHPNADKLTVCRVDAGTEELSILCGAKNMKVGDKVPVALVGAVLPGGIKIQQAKLRGVDSFGMLCSEVELGISEEASGLMILDEDLETGAPISEALDIEDTVIDCEITPNRADCMSMVGIAREVSALSGNPLLYPDIKPTKGQGDIADFAGVIIEDTELCPRYVAKVIMGITIGSSPEWLQSKIIKAGFRPINSVVDITNFISVELGQPLHAFDYNKIAEHKIIVRRAFQDEKLHTLDDAERDLDSEMLVIADPSGAIALAGIMGGANTEVSETTTNILLESAHFNPSNISRTSRRLGLISEASTRFERGVDPNQCGHACERAIRMIQEIAGGTILDGSIDVYPAIILPKTITLRPKRVNKYLGTNLPTPVIADILTSLELDTTKLEEGHFTVRIPTFRFDLEREVDLIEEIARIYGYNAIPSTLPESSEKQGLRTRRQSMVKTTRELMASCGLDEMISYSFIDPQMIRSLKLADADSITRLLCLENPISEDMAIMRPSLLPGTLQALAYNHSHDIFNVGLFEIGRVFIPAENKILPEEKTHVGVAMSGNHPVRSWLTQGREVDFYSAKGIIESLLGLFRAKDVIFSASEMPQLHPERQARVSVNSQDIGFIGELHPLLIEKFGLQSRVAVFELDLEILLDLNEIIPVYEEISKVPGIAMDIAVLVDKNVRAEDLAGNIYKKGGTLLKNVEIFDVYTGRQIDSGKKSVAFSLFLQASGRTLREEEVKDIREAIVSSLKEDFAAEIR